MWHQENRSSSAFFRFGMVLASLFLIVGCASTLSARVTSYQQWPANVEGQTYRIVPSANQANNLEFESFADMLRASIGPTGLVEARGGEPARFDVLISYGNPVSQTWVQRYDDPYLYDGWGFGPAFGGYYGGHGGWWGGMYVTPSVQNIPVEVYKNTLTVIMKDNQNHGTEVYRSSAENVSTYDSLAQVMPYLAQAVFDGFPGNNGEVREINYTRNH
ncbi:DUF4136 domain-containing protein [Candidimonas sp. SYP-B2681]|uniref:DUF4136 domain-containing protein n=1 Tax=Candidimonas sp. SYP-B2681 TaxID=2497686 RepID=UPI000F885FB4|nr:DUF4136 domain-containing protein [Candidimonas sp. SYP-B2681]RTZ40922.1 DUF4136 domain-containing protein [Candidimonas sp. SYP-B2681]